MGTKFIYLFAEPDTATAVVDLPGRLPFDVHLSLRNIWEHSANLLRVQVKQRVLSRR